MYIYINQNPIVMKTTINILSFVIILFLFSSCYTLNTHQTAKTLGKGEMSIQMISGMAGIPELPDDPNNATYVGLSTAQVQMALGVRDNLDLGVTVGFNKLGFLGKYQFLGNQDSKFAMASGAYLYRSFGNMFDFYNITAIDVPLFISYHPVKYLSIYSNPMLTYFDVEQEGLTSIFEKPFYVTGPYKGLSSGMLFDIPLDWNGIHVTTSLDISWLSPLESNKYIFFSTVGIGLRFNSGFFKGAR